jgi:hypothetical protein
VSSFEVWYLARPKGGSFEVLIDNESRDTVETDAPTAEMKFLDYKVTDGAHRLTIKVKKGSVRVFGASLERDVTGILVDGIGMNALNPLRMTKMNAANLSAGLARRNYDLLLETTGTNVWSPRDHDKVWPDLMTLFRLALPNASFMLWSPPDFVKADQGDLVVSEPYMRYLSKAKREMAQASKIGYWDQYEALGGFGSAPKFHSDRWDEPDGVHLGPRMNVYIAERFVYVLLKELARRLDKDPHLGCKR